MYKIIGEDQKEYGPVTAEQIRQWLAEGRADADTKVQREGESKWQRLGVLAEFTANPQARGPWQCPKCGEQIDSQFDSCWRCSTQRQPPADVAAQPSLPPARSAAANWRVTYKTFRGTFVTWDALFQDAAAFATEIGRERLIDISHSEDKDDGVVTVWYWTQGPKAD